MVALKGAEIESFVARPDAARPIVLLFGPDGGLVSERAETIVKSSVDDPADPFALVRLDGEVIASDPARLVDEATTVGLFGGRRAIWVKAGSRNFASVAARDLGANVTSSTFRGNRPGHNRQRSSKGVRPSAPAMNR